MGGGGSLRLDSSHFFWRSTICCLVASGGLSPRCIVSVSPVLFLPTFAHLIGTALSPLPAGPSLQPFFCAEDGAAPDANLAATTAATNDTDLAAATAAAFALLPGHRRRLHRAAAATAAQPPSSVNILLTTLRPLNITVDEEALTVDVDAGVRVGVVHCQPARGYRGERTTG